MKNLLVVLITALLVACGGKSEGGSSGLSVAATFDPSPPKQGNETITVLVKHSDGTPAKGAVVKISTAMPSMSMSGPSVTAKDNGDGSYTANLVLQYATDWTFDITASDHSTTGTTELKQRVQ